ncbi:hypothetical protein AcW1_009481 [Taiwanofungus camphoratus]|nr:hypothetical protein AcV5_002614 [Antrodia cinnamomea]KAI0918798.1 hypothetical protein AcV7_006926 [Antrodia cinnamomea]KAI0947816.1 hypothetical protein AcW1_009481 [Antrodia cinnamomea]
MDKLAKHIVSGSSRVSRTQKLGTRLAVPATSIRQMSSQTPTHSSPSDSHLPVQRAPDGGASFLKDLQENSPYPDLMKPDILMDLHESQTFSSGRRTRFQNRVIVRNDPSMFLAMSEELKKSSGALDNDSSRQGTLDRAESDNLINFLHMTPGDISKLYRYPVIRRRVVQQTGKGKIPRQHVVMVVGNQNGMVGVGEGKALEGQRAATSALIEAVRNMDHIERFEDRTVWTEMETKFSSTRIILRPRPVGFGLHCNPYVYQVLKAAGIKDVSAKVWGSRNPLQVIKALIRMLLPGNAPLGMGNGIGGRGRRMDKGSGLRTQDDLERERGRKLVPLRTW